MLGQATAALEATPRRWVHRIWGIPDIHARQKWAAIWPELAALPQSGLRVVDAGCGAGGWALELAARRPGWSVVGVDRDGDAIARAERSRAQLSLPNVHFVVGDFREVAVAPACDVILSVASAHYLAAAGEGRRLFRIFAEWLKPGGLLLMLAPRAEARNPFVQSLPHPPWHDVFSSAELEDLCRSAGFDVEALCGRIGRPGILAKQLAWGSGRYPGVRAIAYPVEWMMTILDARASAETDRRTLMWLLIARMHSQVLS
jgi:SAM-dependent methyltransferase